MARTGTAYLVVAAHAFYAPKGAPAVAQSFHYTYTQADAMAEVYRDSTIQDGPNEGHGTWRNVEVIQIAWTEVVPVDDGIDPAYLEHQPLI